MAANANTEKELAQHSEMTPTPLPQPHTPTAGIDDKHANADDPDHAKAILPGFAAADSEVAKYLDPTIVIDEETNRRIKKLVRGSWVVGRRSWDRPGH